jgi:hypothetical protein
LPCGATRNNKLADPFSENPSTEQVFKNFITFSNNEDGVLGEVLGSVRF